MVTTVVVAVVETVLTPLNNALQLSLVIVMAAKGHIFDCSNDNQVQQFSKTLDKLAKYVSREFKIGWGSGRTSIRKLPLSTMPTNPPMQL